jgi:hypothetical protein
MGSSVVYYEVQDIPIYNQIVNFNILNDHEHDSNHRPLTLTINFIMHKKPFEDNYDNQRNFIFYKIKVVHQKPLEDNSNNQRNLFFDKNKLDLFLKESNT